MRPYIQKDHDQLPDAYGVTLHYIDGKKEHFEVCSQSLNGNNVFVFCTAEDQWHWVEMNNIRRIEFDKRFSKMIAIREEMAKQKEGP